MFDKSLYMVWFRIKYAASYVVQWDSEVFGLPKIIQKSSHNILD